MVKMKIRPFYAAVRILVILTAILVLMTGCSGKKGGTDKKTESADKAVMYLGGDEISSEEYTILAKEYCNQIYMKYSTEQVNSEGFWETEIEGVKPYTLLEDIILEQLKYNYTLKKLAVKMNVTEDYTYKSLKEFREKENASRKDASDDKVSYGLNSFDEASYYKYWYSNLETKVVNALNQNETDVSESDCRAYYEENREVFSYETGVTVLYAEIPCETGKQEEAKETALKLREAMEKTDSTEEILGEVQDVTVEKLELNSLDTQEGMSGVYALRWERASMMREGEISEPYEDNGSLCIMKCIGRTDNGTLDFESVKSQIERFLKVQEAQKLITEEMEKLKVQKGGITAKEVILSAVK